jgi:hypothetical protein
VNKPYFAKVERILVQIADSVFGEVSESTSLALGKVLKAL